MPTENTKKAQPFNLTRFLRTNAELITGVCVVLSLLLVGLLLYFVKQAA